MSNSEDRERTLVRAIVEADPDDDEPRLVYADHLLTRGDPRGELIVTQCREARSGGDAIENRSLVLFDDNAARWAGAWHGEPGTWRFRRGFLHHLTVPLDTFAVNARLLFELDELPDELIHIEQLVLQQPRTGALLDQLRWREYEANVSWHGEYALCDVHARSVAASIARLRLRELTLRLTLSATFARTLAGAGLAHLRSLAIESPIVERGAVAALLEAPLDRLEVLQLQCRLDDAECAAIVRARCYRGVRQLAVRVSPAAMILMIRANPELTSLALSGMLTGVIDVLGEVHPPLVALDLSRTTTFPVDFTRLAALHTLERLDLSRTAADDAVLETVLRLPRLTSLNLAHTGVSVAGLERIVAEAPPSLRELTITMPPMDLPGGRIFVQRRGHGTNTGLPNGLLERLAARFVLHRWH